MVFLNPSEHIEIKASQSNAEIEVPLQALVKSIIGGTEDLSGKNLKKQCFKLGASLPVFQKFYKILADARIISNETFHLGVIKYGLKKGEDLNNLVKELSEKQKTENLTSYFLEAMKIEKKGKGKEIHRSFISLFIKNPFPISFFHRSTETLNHLLFFGANVNDSIYFEESFIVWAARIKNIKLFTSLAQRGAALECLFDPKPISLFLEMFGKGHNKLTLFEGLNLLQPLGIKPTRKSPYKGSFLEKAILLKDFSLVSYLLKEGFSANETDPDGNCPLLHLFGQRWENTINCFETAVTLLEHKADVHKLHNGKNYLHWAVINGQNQRVLQALIEWGIDPLQADSKGQSPMELALSNGSSEAVRTLLPYYKELPKKQLETALFISAKYNDSVLLVMLLERGGSVKVRNSEGDSLLHAATDVCEQDYIEILIKNGADPNLPNAEGHTPFSYACRNNEDMALHLFHKKGNCFHLSQMGKSPIYYIKRYYREDLLSAMAFEYIDISRLPEALVFPEDLTLSALDAFAAEIEEVIKNQALKNKEYKEILLFSLLFDYPKISHAVRNKVTPGQFSTFVGVVVTRMPELNHSEYLLAHIMEINPEHLTLSGISFEVHRCQDPSCSIEQLEELYLKINFTDSKHPFYYNPQLLVDDDQTTRLSPDLILGGLKELISYTSTHAYHFGTPHEGTEALKIYYDELENLLRHIVRLLKQENDPELFAQTLVQLGLAGRYCGMRWIGDAHDLYLLLASKGVPPTLSDALYSELAILRSSLLKALSKGNVHTYNNYIKQMGKELHIGGSSALGALVDPEQNEEDYIPKERAHELFFRAYHPAKLIQTAEHFFNQKLIKDPSVLFNWFKENVAAHWQGELFQELEIAFKNNTDNAIAEFNKLLQKNYLPASATLENWKNKLEDYRKACYMESEFYDAENNKISQKAVASALVRLNILK